MTLQRIREMCLALPGATEQIQWGNDLVFKIGGKMFCVACTEPVAPPKVAMSFKCDDETFAELVERAGMIPAPYLAQHKWVAPEQFDGKAVDQRSNLYSLGALYYYVLTGHPVHAGAPLIPARAETRLRLPLARSWT